MQAFIVSVLIQRLLHPLLILHIELRLEKHIVNRGFRYYHNAVDITKKVIARVDHRAAAGRQPFVATAPLNLVYIADLQTYEGKGIPEENVLMLCAMDAAGYAENVNLYTAGHALRSITRGSAAADELLSLLRLDPARYRFILAQSVGK